MSIKARSPRFLVPTLGLALCVFASCGTPTDETEVGASREALTATTTDLGGITPALATSYDVSFQSGNDATPCDAAKLEQEKQKCEKDCATRVQNAYGDSYGWTCTPQKSCTYLCQAIAPKSKGQLVAPSAY
jgi:hypothetical protein